MVEPEKPRKLEIPLHRLAVIIGLREFATFLQENPEAQEPLGGIVYHCVSEASAMQTLMDNFGGEWEPDPDNDKGDYIGVIRRFGPAITYRIYGRRENIGVRKVTTVESWTLPVTLGGEAGGTDE